MSVEADDDDAHQLCYRANDVVCDDEIWNEMALVKFPRQKFPPIFVLTPH